MIIETLICLLERMSSLDGNKNKCRALKRQFRGLIESTNTKKKDNIEKYLRDTLTQMYETDRDDIIEKDFSCIKEGSIVVEGTDISQIYLDVLDSDDNVVIRKSTNMMLELFYHIASDEDKATIKEKHMSKKETAAAPAPKYTPSDGASSSAAPKGQGFQNKVENIIKKNKSLFESVEKDPSKMSHVLKEVMSKHSGDFADLLGDTLGSLGLDPSQLATK